MTPSADLSRYFGSLRAETEASWLAQAYLPPRLFGQMVEQRSILVMGEEGSGKSALELSLKDYAAQRTPKLLAVPWRPAIPDGILPSGQTAELFITQAMDSLSFAFLKLIACEPAAYTNAPAWAKDFMHWFVQAFLHGDRQYHLSHLADGAGTEGLAIVTHLLTEPPREIFPRDSLPSSILSHLTSAIKAHGLEGIWVFLEGLDTLFRISPEPLKRFLNNFLSTLDLFEEDTFFFKIVASSKLESLLKARGVLTRRFSVYQLKWSEEELMSLTEKRIALAAKRDDLPLSRLCKDSEWLDWLKKYAGASPRGWLELTRPILDAYLAKGKPLTQSEWLDACRQSPPPLRLDLETGRVFIGWGEVDVKGISYKLLRYLYENRHRPCTKSELYYRAHKGLDHEPMNNEDKNWEEGAFWEGTLDTALYRLRKEKEIEWDSRDGVAPIYIVSERGKGQIRLENAM
ncbi:MAG: winged helix-turn-helix domain-containing protein [Chloroflexota bacterium]